MSESTSTKKDYNQLAIFWAEKYGILTYKVKGKYMIYNQNYNNTEYDSKTQGWVKHPCTFQRKVDLDKFKTVSNIQLKRLQKDGWDNV